MAGPSVARAPGTFEVRAPRDGRALHSLPVMDEVAVRAAVAAARAAQPGWAALRPRDRARQMERVAAAFQDRAADIVGALIDETGKPEAEAMAEVVVSVDLIRYYVSAAPKRLRRSRVSAGWMAWKRAYVERVAYGVVGAITPWNYPLILAMDTVTAALFGGNAVVVKPSEFTPLTTLLLPDLFHEAGLPQGLLHVVTGDGSTGAALVGAGVDKVSFTGSSSVGSKVMAAAAESLTPVTLELGGNDAAIVLEDADLERTARGLVFGGFFNAGQTCISLERVFVVDAVADALIDRVVAETKALRWGSGSKVDVGPIITEPQYAKVTEQIADAVAKGARALTGGVPSGQGRVVEPTVLVDVDETMAVYREETFGPVLPILRVKDEAEAIRRANLEDFGLFASVWTGDRARGERVGRRLRVGGFSVNDSLSHYGVPALPMGGVGRSGFGRRRGLDGLDELTYPRSVLVDGLGLRRDPWWFPYDERGDRLGRAVLAWRTRGGLAGLVSAAREALRR